MSAELLATYFLIAWSIAAFFLSIQFFRWFYTKEMITVKAEFEEIVHEKMQGAMDLIGEAFEGIMSQPIVKGAMTNLGKMGGDAKAENQLIDQMAVDLLDSDQFAAIKMGAEALGLDVEGYIEKHGAIKTLKAAKQIGALAGIDIMKFDLSSLSVPGGGSPGVGNHPFFRR